MGEEREVTCVTAVQVRAYFLLSNGVMRRMIAFEFSAQFAGRMEVISGNCVQAFSSNGNEIDISLRVVRLGRSIFWSIYESDATRYSISIHLWITHSYLSKMKTKYWIRAPKLTQNFFQINSGMTNFDGYDRILAQQNGMRTSWSTLKYCNYEIQSSLRGEAARNV